MAKTKLTFIFLTALILNSFYAFALISGTNALKEKTEENFAEIKELSRQEFHYFAQKLMTKYISDADEVRKDDSVALAYQNLFDVTHYDLSLSFDIPNKSIDGELIMEANSLSDTLDLIYLNLLQNMNVNEVKYLPNPMEMKSLDIQDNAEFKHDSNYIIIKIPDKLTRNRDFAIRIKYSGKPQTLGFDSFSFKQLYGSTVVYNLSEPTYGPTWWPSKDLPIDKATSTVRLKVPAGFKGVSNGTLTNTGDNGDGTTTFVWQNSHPIATYLVSIVVGKFAYWEDSYTSVDGMKTMPVVYYVLPHDSANSTIDWRKTPEMIRLFAKTYGEYPFIDQKYGMAEFGWTSGAMEHQTITSMGYLLLTGDERYEDVVSHELSHQWFGDAVTLADWKNIWLNEGFATYSEALWREYKDGKKAYFDHMKNYDFGVFTGTVYAPEGFISNPAIYATVYQKGGWVLHMLRGIMGDELFFKTMREYFERYKYKNATTQDFQKVAEEIYAQPLDWFFDEWVYKGTGRPKYEYSWKFENFQDQPNSGAYTVRLQLNQVQTDWDVYKMPVKVIVTTEAGDKEFTVFNDQKNQTFLLTVDSKPKEITIDKDGWILKKVAKGKYEK